MDFEYSDPQTELEEFFGGFFHINMFGKIEEGDDEKFRRFLEKAAPPPRTVIYINSGGGHVEAAIGIGRLVRGAWFSTSIGSYTLDPQQPEELMIPRKFTPGRCLSAATLIFLGGRLRYHNAKSQFGVHQFSFTNPTPESLERSQRLSATIACYIADMGVPVAFLELSAVAPGHQMSLLDEEQLRALNVITDGSTEASWGVEVHPDAMWVRGERDSMWGHGKVMLVYSQSDGFSFVAMVEAMGREAELLNFDLVELVVNGEDIRIDVSARCVRAPAGIYVMYMASLSESEAHLLAYSKSFGIQIRASSEAEIFFGIAAVSTKGGEGQLEGLYKLGSR